MIANPTQLEVALHQLGKFRGMLEATRQHLAETDPGLFPLVAEGYLKRIEELEGEVLEYLRDRPAEGPLRARMVGPAVGVGLVKATLVSQLLVGLQSAVYSIGRAVGEEAEGLRSLLALNMVATAGGSFTVVLDLAPRQLVLFEEYDTPRRAVEQLIGYVRGLAEGEDLESTDRATLRALRKVASLTGKGVDRIELAYRDGEHEAEGVVTADVWERIEGLLGAPREGERTVRGILVEINIEENTCKVHPEGEPPVSCNYEENLEDDLIAALKREIEMAGQFVALERANRYRITRIERFRVVGGESENET